nr:reverse transcriptase domain-containing protein [Tanacetum cinerariifolium]
MTDNRTMVEMLRIPTEEYGEAIVVPPILAEQFELKHSLINMMTLELFLDSKRTIRMITFVGAAHRWLKKEPPHSITMWEDLVSKFINEFFPPSWTTSLRNEISNFELKFGESFHEAWDRYKDLLPTPPPAPVKAAEETCVTCGGAHPYYQCLAAGGNTLPEFRDNIQEYGSAAATNYNQGNPGYRPQGVANQIRPPVSTSKPANTPVSASKPNLQASIPYPSRRNDERNQEKAKDQIKKFYQLFKDMSFEISFTDALILMSKFASTLKALISIKEKLSEMAQTPLNEHCSAVLLKKLPKKLGDPGKFLILCDFLGMAECLALADLSAIINLMPYFVWKKLSLPDLTPTCMTLELADRSISRPVGVAEDVYVKTGKAFELAKKPSLLSDVFEGELTLRDGKEAITFNLDETSSDPAPSLPNHDRSMPLFTNELKACEAKTIKSFVDEPPEVELKDLPPHLEYAFLEGDNKLPVIIAKELGDEEKAALIKVLKSHKRAISWKLSDIQGINPEFCTHKILIEEDYKPAVQHQRRVNPKIHDVIKKEVEKLRDAGLIYPISDSPWVSPVHYVPKNGGFTVVKNEENELIPTRLVTGWW